MTFLRAHASHDAWVSQLNHVGLAQEAVPRVPAIPAESVAASFRAHLLQQMMGALDRTSLALNDAEAPSSGLSTPWDHLLAWEPSPHPESPHQTRQNQVPPSPGVVSGEPTQLPTDVPQPASPVLTPAKTLSPPANSVDGFLDKLAGIAQTTAEALGLSPHLLLAQAALETGWGRKAIKTATGQESFNLFGIKADKHWTGETVAVKTTEYIHGRPQKMVQSFRAYTSYAESYADYARLIKHRYGDAMAKGATAEGFGQALQARGYATDPNYAQKIARVAQSVAYRLAPSTSGDSAVA